MSWGTRYRCEFADTKGLACRIDFQWDDYDEDDGITAMQASGDPLTYSPLAREDDLFDNPIRGTKADLRVMATSSFQYIDFFTLTDLQVKALIYLGGDLYFDGFILPMSYSEPYNDTPYEVTISMIDGLGALKSIKYDNAGTLYTGRIFESQILLDILGKIGVTQFSEIVNIYETDMDSGTGDSPIDQEKPDVSIFDGMYCYEVLEYLLNKWNALIRQRAGLFYIYRPAEMIATAYMRTFTGATTKTDSSVNYIQSISRTATASDLRDTNGGTMMLIPPAKKITINQDYGWKDSWLRNWELKKDTFDGTDFVGWTQAAGSNVKPISDEIPEELSGALIDSNSPSRHDYYIEQTIANYSKGSATDIFTVEFEYLLWNTSGAFKSNVTLSFLFALDSALYYLHHNSAAPPPPPLSWIWMDPFPYNDIDTDSPAGSSGWIKFSHTAIGLPSTVPLLVRLCSTDEADIHVAYRNVKFYCSSAGTQVIPQTTTRRDRFSSLSGSYNQPKKIVTYLKNILEKQYNVNNSINGEELNFDYLLGDVLNSGLDNIVEQMGGALSVGTSTLEQVAARFVQDYAAYYLEVNAVVTSDDEKIIFESNDFDDWDDPTTITNISGSLDGTAATSAPDHVHAVAPVSAQTAIWSILFGGSSGSGYVGANSTEFVMSIATDLEAAIADFVSDHYDDFLSDGITISQASVNVLQFEMTPLGDFTTDPYFNNIDGDLSGFPSEYQGYQEEVVGVQRKDTITLTGTSGRATLRCHDNSAYADFDKLYATQAWNTRGGSENDPLLEIIGGEIGHQVSKPRQMLAGLPVRDMDISDNAPHLNILGIFIDDLNIDDSDFLVKVVAGWTLQNCTLALTAGAARFTSTDTDPFIKKAGLALRGNVSKIISLRYRVISGTPGSMSIYYGTSGHGRSASYYKWSAGLDADGEWHTALFDMSDLAAGGTDWIDNIITDVWFDFTENNNVVLDIDWIGFRRFFAFNQGSYDVKNRLWDLDLIEVIR